MLARDRQVETLVEKLGEFCTHESETIDKVVRSTTSSPPAAEMIQAIQSAADSPLNASLWCGATARAYVAATTLDALRNACQKDSLAGTLFLLLVEDKRVL